MPSDHWAILVSAVLLAVYLGAAMLVLFTRRGKQRYGDANARGCMTVVAFGALVLGAGLAIGAVFRIRVMIECVAAIAALPVVLTAFNVVTDWGKALRKKRDASRESGG